MIKFTKKQIQKYKETKAWFANHCAGIEAAGLRINGKKVKTSLLEVTDGKTSIVYTVIGKAMIQDGESINVRTKISTEEGSDSLFLNLDVDAEVFEYKVARGSLTPKAVKKNAKK